MPMQFSTGRECRTLRPLLTPKLLRARVFKSRLHTVCTFGQGKGPHEDDRIPPGLLLKRN